ncbi:hypothetical protein GOBAR_AA04317 [Gossypium barbadense]|uniref:Late embryogenesis abundant protein LEA-2 subgroup domain-containing protein n=1 Tax=Gossypium barbadense TaxID=3634 RepID=A0A2P5YL01_GOSBA|nr:hypothetical protein GOBAR_AA04317 [Gossypium barbadense]
MVEQEQVKPLVPAAFRDEEEALSTQLNLRKRRYVQCCGCIAALSLILAIKINSVTIQRLELINGSLRNDVNVTLLADVSVTNPNVATFKFSNSTTLIYYGGRVIGGAIHLQGQAKARRTLQRNVTVELDPEKIEAVPSFRSDLNSGAFSISSYSTISGRVKILKIVRKRVVVRLNCTTTYRISGRQFIGESCRPELDF